jgi:UTP--glucose-1-phosphate uridylyltransferase
MAVKGVILAAGYGTRFLPVTRVVPKELLPLVDRPALDFIVQEFVEAGIEDILLISSERKPTVEGWFRSDEVLNAALERAGKSAALAMAKPPSVRVGVVYQTQMRGTGDALLMAREFAGDDAVLVAFPDDLFTGVNCATQLIETYEQTGHSVLCLADFSGRDVSRYGVVDGVMTADRIAVRSVVEKPVKGTEPSHWVSLGRYLYTPDFWPVLAKLHEQHCGEGEFYPMDAMNVLAAEGLLSGKIVDGQRHDTGEPLGYLKAVVEVALAREELGEAFERWLRERLG